MFPLIGFLVLFSISGTDAFDRPVLKKPDEMLTQSVNGTRNVSANLSNVTLYENCSHNGKCPQNAFCKWVVEFEYPICACNVGFEDNSSSICTAMYNCSLMDFNDDYLQGDCPNETQFCRNGVCQCLPNTAYNSVKQCEWDVPDETEMTTKVIELKDQSTELPSDSSNMKNQTFVKQTPFESEYIRWTWIKWIAIAVTFFAIFVLAALASFILISFIKLRQLPQATSFEMRPLNRQIPQA